MLQSNCWGAKGLKKRYLMLPLVCVCHLRVVRSVCCVQTSSLCTDLSAWVAVVTTSASVCALVMQLYSMEVRQLEKCRYKGKGKGYCAGHLYSIQWNVFFAFNPFLRSSEQPQCSANSRFWANTGCYVLLSSGFLFNINTLYLKLQCKVTS